MDFDGFYSPACPLEVAESMFTEALLPPTPADFSRGALHPASRFSQRPTALQQPYGTPSLAAPQDQARSGQQSSYAGLATRGPHIGTHSMHEPPASCWAGNDTLAHLATSADTGYTGPTPMPGGVATIQWQPAGELQELGLPGHHQPAGWRSATGWPSHGAPAAAPVGRLRHHKNSADRMPLPSTPTGLSEEVIHVPTISGGLTLCWPVEYLLWPA